MLSVKTVRNHVSNICTRLQVADRTQAMLRARGSGNSYCRSNWRTAAVMATLNIHPHEVCPQWNYTISLRPNRVAAEAVGEVIYEP